MQPQIAVREQEQAAGAIENTIASRSLRPYPPSWVDRLTDWVQGLPGPAWLFYLGVAVVLALIRTVVGWSDGSYPVGTLFPLHILTASTAAYLLFVIHYIDDSAGAALTDFRPVLSVDDAGYESLRYRITTLPSHPLLLWSVVWFLFGTVNQHYFIPETQLQSLKLYTSPAAFAMDTGISGLNWLMVAVFAYHTIHQLRLVSRIYTRHTNVSIVETDLLYGLSRVTALTTVALLFAMYLYMTFWVNWQFKNVNDVVVLLAFMLLGVATFVWPVWGAHRLLQKEKSRRRREVARQMENVTEDLHRRTNAHDYSEMANMNDAMDSLTKEQSAVDKVSTWPWEPEVVRAVATALLLPVVIWVITRMLERLGF